MSCWAVVLLCSVGVACAAVVEQQARPARQARPDSGDTWRNLIAEYARGASKAGGAGGAWAGGGAWFPPPIPVQIPLRSDNSERASVSVLVVPVPVPVPAPRSDAAQCSAPVAPSHPLAVPAYNELPGPTYSSIPATTPLYKEIPVYNQPPTNYAVPSYNPLPALQPSAAPSPAAPPRPRIPLRRPVTEERLARNAPTFPPVEDSRLLVEQFRAQVAEEPALPPIVLDPVGVVSTDDYTVDELREAEPHDSQAGEGDAPARKRRRIKCKRRADPEGGGASELEVEAQGPPPPPPRFERPLFLRGRLTVPRAGYTEPYSVWWDAASGSSRVDFHGGATSTYRMMRPDGRVQTVQIRKDRRCVVSEPRRVTLAERALPALPDLQAFFFAGYVYRGTERAELWRHTLSGHSGELGGARGEALTFRHQLLVTRSADNHTTTPHWYSVRVDSSVLGADCDGYVHSFDDVQARHHDPSMFHLDLADACEQVELTDRMESLEPLREFTMLRRDPRHDAAVQQYKQQFRRTYADDLEEAVRKNVLIQSARHTASGNRQGAAFTLATNFMSDRLAVERLVLLGVQLVPGADPGEPFPFARSELDLMRGRLPRKFDWRERGAVTPVRYQGGCASCWAFSTVGAVEGALFVETGRLVPLSEQALVDCAHSHNAHGCNPTWPSFAYDYIKDQGLPALDEYTPYKAKVLECRADSVPAVTRISGHLNVTVDSILALKVAIKKYGPTVVTIDATTTSLQSYKSGYYHDARCRRDSRNHAVLAVGWTVYRGETYFILKNSWSAAWGEGGYVRMRASTNTCGVLRGPSVPRLRAADVLRVPQNTPSAVVSNNT